MADRDTAASDGFQWAAGPLTPASGWTTVFTIPKRIPSRFMPASTAAALILALATAVPAPLVGLPVQAQDPLGVWAAASMGPVLQGAADAWAREGGGPLAFNVDASSRLAVQVSQGAPAHVLVTADREWMSWATQRGVVQGGDTRVLALNRLVLVAPPGDEMVGPGHDESLSDWFRALPDEVRLAVAGEDVPAGRRAREVLRSLGLSRDVDARLVTGGSVRNVLEWVARGELPLGFVYRSDAWDDPRIRVIATVPDSLHAPIEVLAGVVARSGRQEEARRYLDFLSGPAGQAALARAGFLPTFGPGPGADAAVGPWGDQVGPAPVAVWSAIRLSIRVAILATLLSMVPAVAVGWLLARRPFPGKSLVSAVILTPMVIPPVVTGFLLLSLLGQGSALGRILAGAGLRVPFTFLAAVTAAAVVGFPLFVISVRNAFEAVDFRLEEMSWTLGARPRTTVLRGSLPLAIPGIAAGAVLAFARALGEFGATVVLAGNLEGETRTIALAVYTLLEDPRGGEAVWGLVGASMALSVLALAGFEYLSRRQRRLVRRDSDG